MYWHAVLVSTESILHRITLRQFTSYVAVHSHALKNQVSLRN